MAKYEPRFTSVEAVLRSTRIDERGGYSRGGDYSDDVLRMIAAAEAQITDWCGDDFDLAPADATARVFQAGNLGVLETDAFASIPETVEYWNRGNQAAGATLEDSLWQPVTRPSAARPGRHLQGAFNLGFWYRVTASWGWPAVPAQVEQAAQMLASRLFARQNSPLGVAAGDIPIYVSRHDTDVRALLAPFISASLVV